MVGVAPARKRARRSRTIPTSRRASFRSQRPRADSRSCSGTRSRALAPNGAERMSQAMVAETGGAPGRDHRVESRGQRASRRVRCRRAARCASAAHGARRRRRSARVSLDTPEQPHARGADSRVDAGGDRPLRSVFAHRRRVSAVDERTSSASTKISCEDLPVAARGYELVLAGRHFGLAIEAKREYMG